MNGKSPSLQPGLILNRSYAVLSKLSTRVPLLGNYLAESYLEVGYNECDNPDCKYWNSVQPVVGRYKCKGFLPRTRAAAAKQIRPCRDAADDGPEVSRWSDDSDDEELGSRCPGTYAVSAKQAYYASHLFCAAGSENYKRTNFKRDKAARKAARKARSNAVKLAKEIDKEFKRELMEKEKRRKREWLEDLQREGERAWEKPRKAHEKQVAQQPAQPVKRLKREIRRLPLIVRTPVSCDTTDTGSESSTLVDHTDTEETACTPPPSPPPSTPTTPVLRRRDTPPRPRPTGMVWDEAWATLPARRRAPQAQYPLISRSPNKSHSKQQNADADASTTSLPDMSSLSPLFARNRKTNGARYVFSVGAGYTRSYGVPRPLRVSYKNGMAITHFGTLVPPPQAAAKTGGKNVKSKPQSRVYSGGPGQRRYLILSKVDVL